MVTHMLNEIKRATTTMSRDQQMMDERSSLVTSSVGHCKARLHVSDGNVIRCP